jgi:hypothetical protein
MMLLVRGILIAGFIFGACWDAGAAMPGASNAPASKQGDGVKTGQEITPSPSPASQVRRVTMLVNKIEGGILYTETGQYKLDGVNVRDWTRNLKAADPGKTPKKTAEMTFVNHRLKEVVIRQRQ